MTRQSVAIHERRSYLTASLEREFVEQQEVSFRWFPDLSDLVDQRRFEQFDLIVIDCSDLENQAIQQLAEIAVDQQVLGIVAANDFELQCLLRELGVVSVLPVEIAISRIRTSIVKLLQ